MTATIALMGDTMLGRGVADVLVLDRGAPLLAREIVEQLASADAVVVNLECCISDRGTLFEDARKRFFFRAPPVAAERLVELGDAVTLGNNHALDYRPQALLDTRRHLESAGIASVGAGADETGARAADPALRPGPGASCRVLRPPCRLCCRRKGDQGSRTPTCGAGCWNGRGPWYDQDQTATRCSSRRTGGRTWLPSR